MNVVVRIPDDLYRRLAAAGKDVERRTLEALALTEYQAGNLGKLELRRMLHLKDEHELDAFLKSHGVSGNEARQQEQVEKLLARFGAFRAGKTLGELDPIELIREGRR